MLRFKKLKSICLRPIFDSYNYLFCSAWNERTNSYKTAKFDIVMDTTCAQAKVFELAGMYNIVKHVAEVSIKIESFYTNFSNI